MIERLIAVILLLAAIVCVGCTADPPKETPTDPAEHSVLVPKPTMILPGPGDQPCECDDLKGIPGAPIKPLYMVKITILSDTSDHGRLIAQFSDGAADGHRPTEKEILYALDKMRDFARPVQYAEPQRSQEQMKAAGGEAKLWTGTPYRAEK